MKIIAPHHVEEYCSKNICNEQFIAINERFDDYPHCNVYQLACKCGCENFTVTYDEHPSAWAKCVNCGQDITLYDLVNYPAACKLDDCLDVVNLNGDTVYKVCVMYEYGDDFDGNDDVSWCNIWCLDTMTNELLNIINDETS